METIYTYWINKRGLCATDELYSSRDKQTKTQQFPLPTNGIKPTKICNCLYIKSWKGERVSRFYVTGWSRFCFMVQTVSFFSSRSRDGISRVRKSKVSRFDPREGKKRKDRQICRPDAALRARARTLQRSPRVIACQWERTEVAKRQKRNAYSSDPRFMMRVNLP